MEKMNKESEFSLERTLREFVSHRDSYAIKDMVKAVRQLAIDKVKEVMSKKNINSVYKEIIKSLEEM